MEEKRRHSVWLPDDVWQEGGAVDESFTPAFDTTGVLTSAK